MSTLRSARPALPFLLTAALLVAGILPAAAQPVLFEDASGEIDFLRDSIGSGSDGLAGVAWLDYDADGFLDLYITHGKGGFNGLFRNDRNGGFDNVTEAAGVGNGLGNSGVAAADIDNDGFPEIFLCGDGGWLGASDSPVILYHNNGDGTFEDITDSSDIVAPATSMSAAWGDVNDDGMLDLFITASGSLFFSVQHENKLYLNDGDLTFTDISASSGVGTSIGACANLFTHYDRDEWIDLLVADCNDVTFLPTPIETFVNQGDLTFVDEQVAAGLSPGGFWMGIAPGDIDNDGNMDFFSTNLGTSVAGGYHHALYHNQGDGSYEDIGDTTGVSAHEFGWGCTMRDFNNDGWPDLMFTGAMPQINAIGPGGGNPGKLFFNDGGAGFIEAPGALPFSWENQFSSGLAAGDYNNDGFVDVVIATEKWGDAGGSPILLRNRGNDRNWVNLRLRGVISNRSAIGARIALWSGGHRQIRETHAGSSFGSTESPWPTFGLASNAGVDSVIVAWPSGRIEKFRGVQINRANRLVEGLGVATATQPPRSRTVAHLSQNKPNPFNPMTLIEYSLPVRAHVSLELLDVMGRRLRTLDQGEREAGSHVLRFDGSELSSGTYFYALLIDGTVHTTRKMVLAK